MSKVYLINVGANSSDSSRARSPIFEDDRFIYVAFSFKRRGVDGHLEYPKPTRPFIRNMQGRGTHRDPDWSNLTYGDQCSNRRAAALRRVEVGDILLFWGLLWRNDGKTWQSFDGQRVFIGNKRRSKLFRRAVDLQTTQGSGLLFRTIRAASGKHLSLHGKIPWNSSTRSCRVIWDLELPDHRARARIARKAIFQKTGYDLLRDI